MDSSAQSDSASAVSLTHAAIQRLGRQSAMCKLVSAVVGGVALLFAPGRIGGDSLLVAAALLVLLAVADGCYGAKGRRLAGQFEGGRVPKWGELLTNEVATGGAQSLAGVLSLSVWPYYVALGLMVGGLGHLVEVPTRIMTNGPAVPYAGMPPGFNPGGTAAAPSRPTSFIPNNGQQQPPTGVPGGAPPQPNRSPSRFQTNGPMVPGTGTIAPRPPGVVGPNGTAGPTLQGNPAPRPPTGAVPAPSSSLPMPPAKVPGGAPVPPAGASAPTSAAPAVPGAGK